MGEQLEVAMCEIGSGGQSGEVIMCENGNGAQSGWKIGSGHHGGHVQI